MKAVRSRWPGAIAAAALLLSTAVASGGRAEAAGLHEWTGLRSPEESSSGIAPPDVLGQGRPFQLNTIEPSAPRPPAGSLSATDQARRSERWRGFDCVLDHQRLDRDRRQLFSEPCAPTRDLDVGVPAFTTR